MLETSQERVKLLKAGIDGKTIEKRYLTYNNFKITYAPMPFELIELRLGNDNEEKNNKQPDEKDRKIANLNAKSY